jgi:hypothetical protein
MGMVSGSIDRLVVGALAPMRRQFGTQLRRPIEAQRRVLGRMVRRGVFTRFAEDHDLGGVRDYETFQARVPLRRFDAFAPYVVRIQDGEHDVLLPGRPVYWARTSGTTGEEKLMPLYPAALAQSRRTFQTALALYLAHRPQTPLAGTRWLRTHRHAPRSSPTIAERRRQRRSHD